MLPTRSGAVMDELVNDVVNRICNSLRPDKVYLFGSRAAGRARPDSDIDLLLLYSGPKAKRDVSREAHRLFPHPQFSLDVFVLTPEEFEAEKEVPNTLAREVAETGVVCYG